MSYVLHIMILIGIYVILGVSMNLIIGYTGILSVAHAAFYGIGAYTAALMALKLQTPFLVSLFSGIVFAGLVGILVGIPLLRIRGNFFIIATFAFLIITQSILNNWVTFTSGPMGLPGIPQPTILRWSISSHFDFLLLIAIVCAIVLWVSYRIIFSPFGRTLMAIREDEVFTLASGKNATTYKLIIFTISGTMASVAGVIYAYYISFIDPTSFTIMESIFIISIVIIGGAGSFWGPIIGAALLVTLPEILRLVGLPSPIAANTRQIIYGVLLIVFMLWRPKGLIGKYTFNIGGLK